MKAQRVLQIVIVIGIALTLIGCGLDAEKGANYTLVGSGGGNPPGIGDTRVTLSIGDYDNLHLLYPDVPDTANVYGMGTMFYEWDPDSAMQTMVYLCEWVDVDHLEIVRLVNSGYWLGVALYVDGRTITEEITIRDTVLVHTYYESSPPYVHSYASFALARDQATDSVVVLKGVDNREQMASVRVVYDGWSETCPEPELNGPPASINYPAYVESNLTWGQRSRMYWQPTEQAYAKWFRVLSVSGQTNTHNLAITVDGQAPYERTWGIYIGATELWHKFWPNPEDPWFLFLFGINQNGSVNQGPDNRTGWTG